MVNHHLWKNNIFIMEIYLMNMNVEQKIANIIYFHYNVQILLMEEDVSNILVNVLNVHISQIKKLV